MILQVSGSRCGWQTPDCSASRYHQLSLITTTTRLSAAQNESIDPTTRDEALLLPCSRTAWCGWGMIHTESPSFWSLLCVRWKKKCAALRGVQYPRVESSFFQ